MEGNRNCYKISIITVCYNAAKTIEQTILSVINQSYKKSIEYIIIDGGSTDYTTDIIKKYETEISYWVSEPDHGIYDAMNKGIDKATGEFIQFLGSDDCLIDKDIIRKVSLELNNTQCLSAPVIVVDEELCLQKEYKNNIGRNEVFVGFMLPHPGLFVHREILRKYHFDTNYKTIADYEFLLKYFSNNGEIKYSSEPVVYFSNGGVSSQQKNLYVEYGRIKEIYGLNIDNKFLIYSKSSIIKSAIKFCLKKVFLWKFLEKYRGWEKHTCEWKRCRWCKNK